jgi:hypothetical protein
MPPVRFAGRGSPNGYLSDNICVHTGIHQV